MEVFDNPKLPYHIHLCRFEEGTTAYQAFQLLRLQNKTLEGIQAEEAKAKYVTAALEATRQLLQVCAPASKSSTTYAHAFCQCFVIKICSCPS